MNRVVITGMGLISPIGNNIFDFTNNLKSGKLGIAPISKVQIDDSPIKLAAEVKNYNPENDIDKKEIKRMDLFSQFAISAAKQAIDSSNIDLNSIDKSRMGVIIGSGIGGMDTFESEIIKMYDKGGLKIAPLFIPMLIGNMAAGNVALYIGARGICTNVVTACASATHSIGEAFRNIKHGYSDIIIAGGTEAAITRASIAGFNALKALTKSDDVHRASIPFDKERAGFVIGEGAGVLVLESLDSAISRKANIIAEIVGYGANCDAYHITAPNPDGHGATECMNLAIKEAGILPNEIEYINAHGTGTSLNDSAETIAIKRSFGEHAYKLNISSSKSMTGHLLGAAGAIEAIACIAAINGSFIPPTMGYREFDSDCDLNYTPNKYIEKEINYALSNSLGFGGHNASIIIKKFKGE